MFMAVLVKYRKKFFEDVVVVLGGMDPVQNAGRGEANLIKTAQFAWDNALDGAEGLPVKRLHVAGGINLAYDAVKGKDVVVGKGFHW